ncbi:MAG: diguanylate cyclase domain-containing protein [Desulfovibrio sp.]
MGEWKVDSDTKFILRSFKLFFLLFVVIGVLVGVSITLFYGYQSRGALNGVLVKEEFGVKLQKTELHDELRGVLGDLKYLAEMETLMQFLSSGSRESLVALGTDITKYSESKGVYDQIRFLNSNGMEEVRVNYADGVSQLVPTRLLQNKQDRYYFTDSFKLSRNDIYVSPLDLNVEHGHVERPFKPMIRFAMPVFDTMGQKRGVLVLNYLASNLLKSIDGLEESILGFSMLINRDGYWLKSPVIEDEWGFMFLDGRNNTLANRIPEVFQKVQERDTGQFLHDGNVYTFTTIYPLDSLLDHSNMGENVENAYDEYSWTLISHVSSDTVTMLTKQLLIRLLFLGFGLFIITAVLSWFLAVAITRRRLYQEQLLRLAHIDPLTGLPNRRLFFENLDSIYELARRANSSFGLIYIDVDNFKYVNDTLGHDAGDDLLVELASRLKGCLRKSDTLARLGGDEFVIIVTLAKDRSSCSVVADKITTAMQEPFMLAGEERVITLSLGICAYPDDAKTKEDLLSRSDKAMYQSKVSGKNTVSYYADEFRDE